MGDLNDDPQNKSCSEALGAKKEIKDCVEPGSCFNPWWNILNKGIGTLGYKGNWNLFDQIIFSNYFLKNYDSKDKPTLTFSRAEVLNASSCAAMRATVRVTPCAPSRQASS